MGRLIIPKDRQDQFDSLDNTFKNDLLKLTTALFIDTLFVEGFRSFERQAELYALGRDKAGNIIDKNKIVTNAQPGQSAHNYGLAVDIIPIDPATDRASWNYQQGFNLIANKAKELNLTAGHYWKFTDSPHIEIAGFKYKKYLELIKKNKEVLSLAGVFLIMVLLAILYYLRSK